MKLTLEHLGNRVMAENDEAHDITDAFDLFEDALIQIGYEQERVNAAFRFKAGHIKDN